MLLQSKCRTDNKYESVVIEFIQYMLCKINFCPLLSSLNTVFQICWSISLLILTSGSSTIKVEIFLLMIRNSASFKVYNEVSICWVRTKVCNVFQQVVFEHVISFHTWLEFMTYIWHICEFWNVIFQQVFFDLCVDCEFYIFIH